MQIYFAALAIIGLPAFCAATNLVDYRLIATPETATTCTASGLLCETCSSLVACVLNTDNTFTKQNVKTCSSGEKCVKGGCTTQADPFCDGVADFEFPCAKVGIFPDPFYCDKFVLCVMSNNKLTAYNNKCEDGLGYNITAGICNVKLENGVCKSEEYPVPLCKKAGDTGALKNKPEEYFVCEEYSSKQKVLYPFIRVCPQAQIYDNFECKKK